MITAGLNWWVDGLATVWLGLEGRVRRARRFRLVGTAWPFVLEALDGPWKDAAGRIELSQSLSADVLSRILLQTRGSVFEIAIPAAALLERKLEPLPRESKPYVESAVRHQIETIFPWNARDVVHTALTEDRSDGRIDVTVRATSRSAIEPALSVAAACEASEVMLVGAAAAGHERDLAVIRVPLGKHGSARIERARAVARYAIGGLLVTALSAIGWTSFVHWSTAGELAALEQTIADRRAVLTRASATRDAAGDGGLEARKQRGPLAVLVLERLSALLPDDTYLTDLSLDGERLRIAGVSGQAAELVPLLEKSGHFRNASFYAPTTRIPGNSSDRFSIEAMIHSQAEAKR